MDHPLITASVLALGLALTLLVQHSGRRPSLGISLAVGVAFRMVILASAATSTWQPADYIQGFQAAGEAVRAGQDPVLGSAGSWHFLPMIPYFSPPR